MTCNECYWHRPNDPYIKCLNVERENWKSIEESNICKDIVLPSDFKPDPIFSLLVREIDKAIKECEGDGY